jgi:hypothetical protein
VSERIGDDCILQRFSGNKNMGISTKLKRTGAGCYLFDKEAEYLGMDYGIGIWSMYSKEQNTWWRPIVKGRNKETTFLSLRVFVHH